MFTGAATAKICTVTGPTVIDFSGKLNAVKDRCAYTLMENEEFSIVANFRDRRRRDVSFVDSVTLKFTGDTYDLQQGGRVVVSRIQSIGAQTPDHDAKLDLASL